MNIFILVKNWEVSDRIFWYDPKDEMIHGTALLTGILLS